MSDFIPFPKIPRLRRDIVITEKIDGTNVQKDEQPKVLRALDLTTTYR
jgi:hypothetical protein